MSTTSSNYISYDYNSDDINNNNNNNIIINKCNERLYIKCK